MLPPHVNNARDFLKEKGYFAFGSKNQTDVIISLMEEYATAKCKNGYHECRYCGCMTHQPDELCYKAPHKSCASEFHNVQIEADGYCHICKSDIKK